MAQFIIKIVKSSSSMDAEYYADVVVNSTLYCFDFEYWSFSEAGDICVSMFLLCTSE